MTQGIDKEGRLTIQAFCVGGLSSLGGSQVGGRIRDEASPDAVRLAEVTSAPASSSSAASMSMLFLMQS